MAAVAVVHSAHQVAAYCGPMPLRSLAAVACCGRVPSQYLAAVVVAAAVMVTRQALVAALRLLCRHQRLAAGAVGR